MKFLKIIIFTIFVSSAKSGNEIGEVCEKNGVKGVCTSESNCYDFAMEKAGGITDHICYWGSEPVICCPEPTTTTPSTTTKMTTTFKPTKRDRDGRSQQIENSTTYCQPRRFTQDADYNSINDLCDRVQKGCIPKGKYPHIAALAYESDKKIEFGCGGGLISKKYVLTAARE
jgi:hypothetical protein